MRTYRRTDPPRTPGVAVIVCIVALLGGLLASGAGAAGKGPKLPKAGRYEGKVGAAAGIVFNVNGHRRAIVRLTAEVTSSCLRSSDGYLTETKKLATWPAEQEPRAVLKIRKRRPEGDFRRRWYWGFAGSGRDKGGTEWSIVGRFVSRTKARGTFQVRRSESISNPLEPEGIDSQLCDGFDKWTAARQASRRTRRR